jgi:dGTPase
VGGQPSLEAQLCNLADEIAYNAHDMDDGVRSGLITMDQLQEVSLFAVYRDHALLAFPELASPNKQRRLLFETIRRMLSAQVYDLIAASQHALRDAAPQNSDTVREMPPLLAFSEAMRSQSQQLKKFLFRNLYRHPQVMATSGTAQLVVRELFAAYVSAPHEMSDSFSAGIERATTVQPDGTAAARVVADYIAGMTDRFASREHARLTGKQLLV